MSKLALTEIQHQKMKKLLDDTYPIGKILLVDTSAIPPELGRGIKRVQDNLYSRIVVTRSDKTLI